jgi:hypothetical protein
MLDPSSKGYDWDGFHCQIVSKKRYECRLTQVSLPPALDIWFESRIRVHSRKINLPGNYTSTSVAKTRRESKVEDTPIVHLSMTFLERKNMRYRGKQKRKKLTCYMLDFGAWIDEIPM